MIRIVKMTFLPKHIEDFKSLFEERKEQIRNFEGCEHLELWQDYKDDRIFYTYSLWQEADFLEKYRTSELFKQTWTCVRAWFEESPHAFSAENRIKLP